MVDVEQMKAEMRRIAKRLQHDANVLTQADSDHIDEIRYDVQNSVEGLVADLEFLRDELAESEED
jgi:hypothetical protein